VRSRVNEPVRPSLSETDEESERQAKTQAVLRALDEARFGPARTLNLRSIKATGLQAERRVDAWLREQQVSGSTEVLIVTGRGRGSDDGIPVLRPTVERRLSRLRRLGVVASVAQHTPGSFVVTLAPLRALLTAPARRKDRITPRPSDPAALRALAPETRNALRALAVRALEALGVPTTCELVHDEMQRQFDTLARGLVASSDRDATLRAAAIQALQQIEDE
jgi:hypothetical protein